MLSLSVAEESSVRSDVMSYSSAQCHREIPTSDFQVDLGAHNPSTQSASFPSTVGGHTMSPATLSSCRIKRSVE